PLQLSSLRKPGQDRARDAQGAGLRGCHQAIVLLGQGKQFVHTGAHGRSMGVFGINGLSPRSGLRGTRRDRIACGPDYMSLPNGRRIEPDISIGRMQPETPSVTGVLNAFPKGSPTARG